MEQKSIIIINHDNLRLIKIILSYGADSKIVFRSVGTSVVNY